MRAAFLPAAALVAVSLGSNFLAGAAARVAAARPARERNVITRRQALNQMAAEGDPFFRIRSKGRTGAAGRAAEMAEGLRAHRLDKRLVRQQSNPFKTPARMMAFYGAVKAGTPRSEAMKIARRVPA